LSITTGWLARASIDIPDMLDSSQSFYLNIVNINAWKFLNGARDTKNACSEENEVC
jgi:hypothetical protein